MSLWSRLWSKLTPPDAPQGGRALEEKGDFAGAAAEYEREGLFDDALRMLLVLADADVDPSSRVRTLARALRMASQKEDPPRELRARYSRARLDVLRSAPAGGAPVWELSSIAKELEELEEFEAAADAYGLAGDRNAQVRLLAAAGKIEELEGVLNRENERTRSGRLRTQVLADASTLVAGGQRVEALTRARTFADLNPGDEEVSSLIRSLRERLVRPPIVHLEWEGSRARYVLLDHVVLGRTGSTIDIPSPMLSRRHLMLSLVDGVPTVEDLATRNGTLLAGARLGAPVAVRSPMTLHLGGEIACQLEPHPAGGLSLEVAGERYVLPLGPEATVGPWRVRLHPDGEGLRLTVPAGAPRPLLQGSVAAADGLDLCFGDVIHRERGGPVVLRVLA